jgi:Transglutaminase-like superfamily
VSAGTRTPARGRVEDADTPLAPGEKIALAAEIAATYVRARWWLRSRPPAEAVAAARRDATHLARAADPRGVALRLGRIVERALDHLPGDTRCLTRSLVLVHLLARRGIPAKLVIGVEAAPFRAHAWVEHEGEPVLDPGGYGSGRLTEL